MIRSNRQPGLGLVLLTGAGGFIGRRLVALLHRSGVAVHGVRSAECDLRQAGETRALVDARRPRTIVNLAHPSHAADQANHEEHVEIARNLLAAARSAGVRRLIQLGSSTEFAPARSPVDDDTPPRPTTPFGIAKARASSLVLDEDGRGIRTTVLRPFSVYGPGDLPRHLVPTAIEAALTRGTLPLAAGVRRDWVFVDDVALACALALDGRADGLAVNLASGVATPNDRVVELVEEATGRRIDVKRGAIPPRPWDAGITGATERAARVLGWTARTGLREGIQATLAADRPARPPSRMSAAG